MSVLVISEILGLIINTLTADDKYSLHNRKNLRQPIKLQLSRKKKIFSRFFHAYLKSTSYFEHFEKKDRPDRLCIFKITNRKISG